MATGGAGQIGGLGGGAGAHKTLQTRGYCEQGSTSSGVLINPGCLTIDDLNALGCVPMSNASRSKVEESRCLVTLISPGYVHYACASLPQGADWLCTTGPVWLYGYCERGVDCEDDDLVLSATRQYSFGCSN
jgi:hypothetical protein